MSSRLIKKSFKHIIIKKTAEKQWNAVLKGFVNLSEKIKRVWSLKISTTSDWCRSDLKGRQWQNRLYLYMTFKNSQTFMHPLRKSFTNVVLSVCWSHERMHGSTVYTYLRVWIHGIVWICFCGVVFFWLLIQLIWGTHWIVGYIGGSRDIVLILSPMLPFCLVWMRKRAWAGLRYFCGLPFFFFFLWMTVIILITLCS